ncbi:MAG: YerC/YecD family TrpR-related protein [Bdellovibrionota bacterium]
MPSFPSSLHRDLIETLAGLKDERQLARFLRDLLTDAELDDIAKRWQAVRLLNNGESYRAIIEQTGLSSTTVARISKWLQTGTGGYRQALKSRAK